VGQDTGDDTMVLAWAGFDHAQLAQATTALAYQRRDNDGWTGEDGRKLLPLLAALVEVLPWVHQWHPDVDPGLGQTLGTFYQGQLEQFLATIGSTPDDLTSWTP
jgi:hypothetical protein